MLPSCSLCVIGMPSWGRGYYLEHSLASDLIKVISNLENHILLNEKSFLNSKSLPLHIHRKAWVSFFYKL